LASAWGTALASSTPTFSQNFRGDAKAGRELARAWCSDCHSPEEGAFLFAPPFAKIAKLPSTTALSLKVFLQTNHKNMPDISLTPGEADDIIAYILSLKRK
jgi:mono/diheme cytochrome c family protein